MTDIFAYDDDIDSRRVRARTLLITLGGFHDAGHVQRQVDALLADGLTGRQIGRFDADALVDHRGSRPTVIFERDHFTHYEAPRLVLAQYTDEEGTPFLVLSGAEPSLRWEALAREIERIVRTHDVERVVTIGSMPMPVPHTRPVLLTRHASDPSLIPNNRPTFGTVLMGASFPAMLELRLGEAGHAVIGITAHVPHYLMEADYPDATLAVLAEVRALTGLRIPTRELAVAAGVVRAQLGAAIADNEEFAEQLSAMEEQYDAHSQRQIQAAQAEADLPTADEIGAEAEDFLRTMDGGRDDGPDDEPPGGATAPGEA